MVLIDVNNRPIGKQADTIKMQKTIDDEIIRTATIIEIAGRKDISELCAQLDEINKSGWRLLIDKELPDDGVDVVLMIHNQRKVDGTLSKKGQRGYIGLGLGYADALAVIAENNLKEDMIKTAKDKG